MDVSLEAPRSNHRRWALSFEKCSVGSPLSFYRASLGNRGQQPPRKKAALFGLWETHPEMTDQEMRPFLNSFISVIF